jgi:hypothetical protein
MEPLPPITDDPFISDRDLMAAIFSGIAVLAKELTGKNLVATFHDEHCFMNVHGGPNVKLTADSSEADARPLSPNH